MAIRIKRVAETLIEGDLRHADSGQRAPLCITLAPHADVTPSEAPPVRIFLGTEAVQFRAERAFVYSIERVRDPARTYEIYLMKDFEGFERRLWLTGFTNYRFMIPELAGGTGRAIYNDTDQIYLRDPAELFDADMGEAGVLSINDHDTSVMLIDCARMVRLWNGRSARRIGNRELERRMREADLWGDLDNAWNARDAEYVADASKVVHYTTIHTQPWRPTPQDFVYGANPAADIWHRIEAEADAAGFQVWNSAQPSPLLKRRFDIGDFAAPARARLADFVAAATDVGARRAAYYGYDRGARLRRAMADIEITMCDFADLVAPRAEPAPVDMVFADGLAEIPDTDTPWILDALFARARRAVVVAVTLDTSEERDTPADAIWWYQQLVSAGSRAPDRHWRLVVRKPRRIRKPRVWYWSGGALARRDPQVWALTHYKTGHRSQTLGVAQALGWPVSEHAIRRSPLTYAGAIVRDALGIGAAEWPHGLAAPWPDVIVASGWLPAVAARAVARRSRARTRLVLMGRRGGRIGETQNIAIVCKHFDLPPNPRQIETLLPPSKVATAQLREAEAEWPDLFAGAEGPRVAWLVGGDTVQHALDDDTALALTQRIRDQVHAAAGQLAVLTSRRTSQSATDAIRAGLYKRDALVGWGEHSADRNPYLGYLAHADVLVVTGESESMLAEAVATGKPVYIAPLPTARPNLRRRLADRVIAQAGQDRFNKRGSARPQEGLQYICARLVERRIFVPRRNMPELHDALVDQGVARMLGDSLTGWRPPAWHETEWLARRIRALLPLPGERAAEAESETPRTGDSRVRVG
ncbi:ELM1/GtrOC1 family putative glycosyltransferase [Salinisphaera sp. Q1T1-3]|uniref:ELM1/GtrOC1 family putative glycosyltransferase n=1 Tax=Salinisphaera sp. Q1T1-3 TaxID=2321229 RepID=UPI000E773753|nr:ELM1/GtrOC1 family putative glycosyltransferase [Salinisphaera sp. Q1T1-3]RJS92209.1 hypothetical protein D3260_12525 [Salinisphaera sp. Q1T1-3]